MMCRLIQTEILFRPSLLQTHEPHLILNAAELRMIIMIG